jgi:alkanesulfonate monooxygenase SsuD/methylene tetrahydromethanopterin reductase-like flavin-dependent oxidoreductase (luciferase family)
MDSARAGALYRQSREIVRSKGIDLVDDWDEWFGGISLIYVAESDAKAKKEGAEHVKRYLRALSLFDTPHGTLIPGYRSAQALGGFLEQSRAARSSEARDVTGYSLEEGIEKGIFLVGSPDSVFEQLKRKKEESKLNALISFMRFGRMSKDEAFTSIQLFADEVLPQVRGI